MKYEIRNLKNFATPDGGGFNANLYRDGTLVAKVHDGGHGGVYEYHWLDYTAPRVDVSGINSQDQPFTYKGTKEEALLQSHVNTLPFTTPCDLFPKGYRRDMDGFVGELCDYMATVAKVTRQMKTKLFFVKVKGGPIYTVKLSPGVYPRMKEKNPSYIFLGDVESIIAAAKESGE